jgi:Na+-translocating ferredoxin:NAD+ oxidoreductase RnfC subunit
MNNPESKTPVPTEEKLPAVLYDKTMNKLLANSNATPECKKVPCARCQACASVCFDKNYYGAKE